METNLEGAITHEETPILRVICPAHTKDGQPYFTEEYLKKPSELEKGVPHICNECGVALLSSTKHKSLQEGTVTTVQTREGPEEIFTYIVESSFPSAFPRSWYGPQQDDIQPPKPEHPGLHTSRPRTPNRIYPSREGSPNRLERQRRRKFNLQSIRLAVSS